jgi:lambda repressor-like predicted transcriptional regulator
VRWRSPTQCSSTSAPTRTRLVVVGESTVREALDKAALKAEKQIAKELDVSPKDVDAAIQQAAGEVS